jgi:LmbE family N-acetylglucosaminyl deacetylase
VNQHSLLCVFAHPDDETTVAPMLARYAAEGHAVSIACITSGQKGYRPHCNIPPGDELGTLRAEELRASCRALGIREPYLLGFQDQGFSTSAVAGEVTARLREIVAETRADVLLTWGPDGITGHIDHRMASSLASVLFAEQRMLAHKPSKLYFLAFPESLFAVNPNPLNRKSLYQLVGDEFVTTEIDARSHLDAALNAIRCHRTQWRAERMEQVHGMYANFFGGKVYLRLAMSRLPVRPAIPRETSLFEGL